MFVCSITLNEVRITMLDFEFLNYKCFSVEVSLALVVNDAFYFSVITVIKVMLDAGRLR
jgi:hypothetical protein